MNLSHQPLHHAELERAVIGAVLSDSRALREATALLRAGSDVFYNHANGLLFAASVSLGEQGEDVDALSVISELSRTGKLKQAGGADKIMGLPRGAASTGSVSTHCKFLLELYAKRKVGEMARALFEQSLDEKADFAELMSDAQAKLTGLYGSLNIKPSQRLGDLITPVLDGVQRASLAPRGLTGLPSGLRSVDSVTSGWQPSDLVIIAARPSMGKTTLAMFLARHAADNGKHAGAVFTLEMSTQQLVLKLIASESGYTTAQLRHASFTNAAEELDSIREKTRELAKVGLFFDDTPAITITELRAKVSQLVAEEQIKFVVIDYLQLMQGDKRGTREQEISSISRGLKLIAKENNIVVFALSQLSRSVESRGGDKKPMLSDLRESGAIEQDADLIVFPYRSEYYKIYEDEFGNSTINTTELIIAKHRNGSLATLIVGSRMDKGIYYDLEEPVAPPVKPESERFSPLRTAAPSYFDDAPAF